MFAISMLWGRSSLSFRIESAWVLSALIGRPHLFRNNSISVVCRCVIDVSVFLFFYGGSYGCVVAKSRVLTWMFAEFGMSLM